jgi:hypothetical protein
MSWQHVGPIHFSPKEKLLPHISGICIIGGKVALVPTVSSNGMTYANVVSIPAEEHNRYMIYITTYPPSGAYAFNITRTTQHTLREHIYVLRKRPQDIPRSPCPRCAVVTSRMTDTQPLPHDRGCPQANLVLRRRIRDSNHPAGGYLPSYLDVGASLQKVNAIFPTNGSPLFTYVPHPVSVTPPSQNDGVSQGHVKGSSVKREFTSTCI